MRGHKSGENKDEGCAKGEKKRSRIKAHDRKDGEKVRGMGYIRGSNLGSNKDKGAAKEGRNKSFSFR